MHESRQHLNCSFMKPYSEVDDDNVFLLFLDGGGIRGLVFIQAVIELDKRHEQLYQSSEPFLKYSTGLLEPVREQLQVSL